MGWFEMIEVHLYVKLANANSAKAEFVEIANWERIPQSGDAT